ncbi:MAG: ATP-binding protein [Phycisphaerales bacterium]|nr:ATP-binding protein [Phycisphaerales bacterium]
MNRPSPSPYTSAPDLHLRLVSDPNYLSGTRELVAGVAKRLGFGEEACGHIALAVDEALCNIIRHGYDKRRDGPIWVSLWPSADGNGSAGITVVIEDEAKQIDPGAIKGRNLDDIRPGGLGVHIIKEVMDEVRYEKRDKVGMRLTLIKHRAAVPAGKGGGA